MDVEWGDFLIAWTARLTVFAYLLRMAGERFPSRINEPLRRWFWTCGAVMCVVHLYCTFEYAHHWSQQSAWKHTEDRMRELMGWGWGGGVYVNYAFTLFWLGDCIWWWRNPQSHRNRPRWLRYSMHSLFAIVIVNATVVFGPPFWWVIAVIFTAAMYMPLHRRNHLAS